MTPKKQPKKRYFKNINFPTKLMKTRFEAQLLAYRSQIDPSTPTYQVLADLMRDALTRKLDYNTIDIPREKFSKKVKDWEEKNLNTYVVEERTE